MSLRWVISDKSVSWPSASTRESASSSSNSPVPTATPFSSSVMRSSISRPPSACVTVDNQRIWTPSAWASRTSSSWAGIRSRVRR